MYSIPASVCRLLATFSLFIAIPFCLLAQVSDNFDDGDFTNNPTWIGDTERFVVNAAKNLQLNAPDGATSAVLAVAAVMPTAVTWTWDIRLDFDPSTTNQVRLYLQSDQANLVQANGYVIEIGESGTQDVLRFYRQDGGARTLLARGSNTVLTNSTVNIRLQVERTNTGQWQISTAPWGSTTFQPHFQAADNTYRGGAAHYVGWHCIFTSTRRDKFYSDNIYLSGNSSDKEPPTLEQVQVENAQSLLVRFNESLSVVSAEDTRNYVLEGGPTVQNSELQPDGITVRLTLANALQNGRSYTLTVSGVGDLGGNVLTTPQKRTFNYMLLSTASEFDILLNEIMADPSPSVGLPEVEWIELYNRSNKNIDLQTLRLADEGGKANALPAFILLPDSFVVLTTVAGATALRPLIGNKALSFANFPSLNNDADALTLTNADGAAVDAVAYQAAWHTTTSQRDGGGSLERINPNTPCLGRTNWTSAAQRPGGTPGRVNSVLRRVSDVTPPTLRAARANSPTEVLVTFSEGMDINSTLTPSAYRLQPVITVNAVKMLDRATAILTLSAPLQSATRYRLTTTSTLTDCSGNQISGNSEVVFGLPEMPMRGDIVFNEVLFNPPTGGVRYIELYNRTQKFFDWSAFSLDNDANGDAEPIQFKQLLLPNTYIVFTPDTANVRKRFQNINIANLIAQDLPGMDDKAGALVLRWTGNGRVVVVDSFAYQDNYHNALFNTGNRDGVALERIRTDGPTNDAANWTSAAPNVTGAHGTPTLPNSQQGVPTQNSELLTLLSDRLSPDGDGFEDFIEIQYALPAPGYALQAQIFDAAGHSIFQLARQNLAGLSGTWRWDGNLPDGSVAPPGIYILYAEAFAADGNIQRLKKAFAVVQR